MDKGNARVIIVGAGNAALSAALSASEAGAQVVVLEAAPVEERGGNSRFSGSIFRFAHEGWEEIRPLLGDALPEQAAEWTGRVRVKPYPPERFLTELVDASGGRADRDLLEVLVSRSQETMWWLKERGVQWEFIRGKLIDPDKLQPEELYWLPEGGAVRSVDEGVGLVAALFTAVESDPRIEVRYRSPVRELLTEGQSVTGVRVQAPEATYDLNGTVVLACGGFEASPRLRRQYLGENWDLVKVRGTRFNTGGILEEAIRIGAQAVGHWGGCHAALLASEAPAVGDITQIEAQATKGSLTSPMSRYSYPYSVMVNLDGERFVDEGEDEVFLTYATMGRKVLEQRDAAAFQIFDQRTVQFLEQRYESTEPVVAGSIAALARGIGIDPGRHEATVADYNAATPRSDDFDAFTKDGLATSGCTPPKSNWALPLDAPPYLAYGVTCGITFTYGGLRIDTTARVHDDAGQPIKGLFATGEITGGFFFDNYPGGSGLMRGAVFGRIAGREAARRLVPASTGP